MNCPRCKRDVEMLKFTTKGTMCRDCHSLVRLVMHDLPGMTVVEHHALSIGLLATCHQHVPEELKKAIAEALDSAKQMGMNIQPELVTQMRSFCV